MRSIAALVLLLASWLPAHADIALYTGHVTMEGEVWTGFPGPSGGLTLRYTFDYTGPMEVSLEQTPFDCDGRSPGAQESALGGFALEPGSWTDVVTGESGQGRAGFWIEETSVGPAEFAECYTDRAGMGVGPASLYGDYWSDPPAYDVRVEGSRLLVDLLVLGEFRGGATLHFEGTRIDFSASVSPGVLNLGSRGSWISATLSSDGSIPPERIDLTSLSLEGVPARSAKVSGRAVVARFPREEVASRLRVGPEVPVSLTARILDGPRVDATTTLRVIDPVPRTLFVDAHASGANDGTSWADAYTDLQDALSRATRGDEIWVADGVYRPTDGLDSSISFRLPAGVGVFGGFEGFETSRDTAYRDRRRSVLSGDLGVQRGPGDPWDRGEHLWDNSKRIVDASATDSATRLDGFTITAGLPNPEPGEDLDRVAALLIDGGQPRISNLLFLELNTVQAIANIDAQPHFSGITVEHAFVPGGAISNSHSDAVFEHIEIRDCAAHIGSGTINNLWSHTTIRGAAITANSAQRGAGINIRGSTVELVDVVIRDNYAGVAGGAIYADKASEVSLVNAVLANNQSSNGGAIYASTAASRVSVLNSTIWDNRAVGIPPGEENGQAILTRGTCEIVNSIVGGGPPESLLIEGDGAVGIASSLVIGSGGSGPDWRAAYGTDRGGNIDADPRFVDAESGDLHLTPSSPAIDAGRSEDLPRGLDTDLDGDPRVVGAAVDMGAYEFQGPGSRDLYAVHGSPGVIDANVGSGPVPGTPSLAETTTPPRAFLRVSPNPFNPRTTIHFGVEQTAEARLVVYDLAGRRVKTLVSGRITAGPHDVDWDGCDDAGRRVASGMYLYRLEAGAFVQTRRMVLLK